MKNLLRTAVVLAVSVSAMSYLAVPAQAAHAKHARHVAAAAKSPYCNMAKASNNGYAADVSWAAYYHCW
jgi:hypothetical protein